MGTSSSVDVVVMIEVAGVKPKRGTLSSTREISPPG
jgi:hypothetical protein